MRSIAIRALRLYLAHFPFPRGKGLIVRRLLWPLQPGTFLAELPGGGRVELRYRETLGLAHFVNGGFEPVELRTMLELLSPGAVVLDVGANVGYLTVPLALALGESGRLLAFEPEAENVRRLRANLALNELKNVDVRQIAIGAQDGEVGLVLADDPAYHSTATAEERRRITSRHETGRSVSVPMARLDTVWREAGSPVVKLVKIDVEGAELDVLEGANELLMACRPGLLIESTQPERVQAMLGNVGWAWSQPDGFAPANYLGVAN